MLAPPIDKRSYQDLVAETRALARQLSGWQPRPDGRPDAGQALIRIFGKFAELVVERVNRAPEKNYLAFLNLIGTSMLPPQPARVPLTFQTTARGEVSAVVPAGVQVAAPPLEGEAEEVVFETERSLVVTSAQLQAVCVSDTETDTYSDRTAQATGLMDEPFAVFTGDRPTPHHLYLACDPVLTLPDPQDVTLTLRSPDTWQWTNWPISWSRWDGTGWQVVSSNATVEAGAWRVTLPQLPPLTPHVVNGIEAAWLRAALELTLPPAETGHLPESVAIGAKNPQNLSTPLAPFGDTVSVKRFYLSADDAFGAGGARARMRVRLSRRGAGANVQLTWSYLAGDQWLPLGQSSARAEQVGTSNFALRDGTLAFTRDGEISFQVPMKWPRSLYRSRSGRWLRVDIGDAQYTTPPEIASLTVGFDWDLPQLSRITVGTNVPPRADIPVSACLSYNDFTFVDHTADATQGSTFAPFTPTADTEPALYLGVDQPFDPRPVTLYLQVEPPRPEEAAADRLADLDPATAAQIGWEYASPAGWQALSVLDETQALSTRGLVNLVGPDDFTARSCFGLTLYWLRARWRSGAFPLTPRLRRVLLNTTWAAQVLTVEGEILGSSNGNPNQTFMTAQTPVQPGQRVVVRERERPSDDETRALVALEGRDAVTVTRDAAGQPDEIWVRWHAVPDFYESGPRDRHYTLDPLTGEIRFGDGSHGLIPPLGQNNVRVTYRTGGGEQGNRAAGTIVQLKSGIPFVDAVTNHEPAQGGAPREPIDRLKARGPRVLRHRERAIAAQDLEDLALAASAEVARVAAVVPRFNPYNLWLDQQAPAPTAEHLAVDAGRMGVIVVPRADTARPTPSLSLLRRVASHLRERCPPTADVWVAGPEWIRVAVDATVAPASLDVADAVGERVRSTLERFLHPLTGGVAGDGWPFGRKPHQSDLFSLVEAIEGVDHVRSLAVTLQPETADVDRRVALQRMLARPLAESSDQPELERDLQRWLARALVYSGRHQIDVALPMTRAA